MNGRDLSSAARARQRLERQRPSLDPIGLALASFLVGLCVGVTIAVLVIAFVQGELR